MSLIVGCLGAVSPGSQSSQILLSVLSSASRGRGLFDRQQPLFPSLLEYRPAGLAEVGFLAPQAGGDRPHIWNFTGAEAVHVGRARPFLFGRREFGERGANGQSEKTAERQCQTDAFCDRRRSIKSHIKYKIK